MQSSYVKQAMAIPPQATLPGLNPFRCWQPSEIYSLLHCVARNTGSANCANEGYITDGIQTVLAKLFLLVRFSMPSHVLSIHLNNHTVEISLCLILEPKRPHTSVFQCMGMSSEIELQKVLFLAWTRMQQSRLPLTNGSQRWIFQEGLRNTVSY